VILKIEESTQLFSSSFSHSSLKDKKNLKKENWWVSANEIERIGRQAKNGEQIWHSGTEYEGVGIRRNVLALRFSSINMRSTTKAAIRREAPKVDLMREREDEVRGREGGRM